MQVIYFPTAKRQKKKKISNIESYLEEKLHIRIPTSTQARKIGATVASQHLNSNQNELICTQMSHSMAVHTMNYKARCGLNDAAEAHQAMESLRKKVNPPALPSVSSEDIIEPEARRRWGAAETKELRKIFKKYIEQKITPPSLMCARYEEMFGRDKKQIQDKVKNINKYS